ncbi:MAG: hypothetical protein R3190_09150, partial [Thermoanaerobaculia bacterium]|nr:hypothetical protein [Thermoanaerobaculia bacterium]
MRQHLTKRPGYGLGALGVAATLLVLTATGAAAGVPECPDHDPTRWHALLDAARQCHYDHEHKHDPDEVADIFGPAGAWFGGTSLSYPWQTFYGADADYPEPPRDAGLFENAAKHESYGWVVRRDLPANGRDLWIRDLRLQYHALSAPPGTLTRFHSYSLEARLCRAGGTCGLVRTGGWVDFGALQGDNRVILPGEGDLLGDLGRQRIHFHYEDVEKRT